MPLADATSSCQRDYKPAVRLKVEVLLKNERDVQACHDYKGLMLVGFDAVNSEVAAQQNYSWLNPV